MFNTLKYAKKLEEVGFSREQAEMSIKILLEVMEDKLATKDDIERIENKIEQTKSELTIKLGAMVGAMLSVSVALITLLVKFL